MFFKKIAENFRFSGKKVLWFTLVLVILGGVFFVLVFPFDEKTLVERLFNPMGGNLISNPSFEKGSGDLPDGWSTRTEYRLD